MHHVMPSHAAAPTVRHSVPTLTGALRPGCRCRPGAGAGGEGGRVAPHPARPGAG
ncbi:hypothetical protein F751_1920 [Auxenochlorella protothecoides]|uniref:Uncharacterized protein n=1 Tax=Auxenochlorella protothecoides TaxID=3075 RepID=A0A087SH37_AUXPR|nr:hypothetical protein F751_1920 [Auxenochlorella protothecoides]KFM25041.1 hypothetical protein F751_1920 [Auxenochlorella protothecoides]